MSFVKREREEAFKTYSELGVDLSKYKSEAFVHTIVGYEGLGYADVVNLRRKVVSEHQELFHKAYGVTIMQLSDTACRINSATPPTFVDVESFSLKMVRYGETIGLCVNVRQLVQAISDAGIETHVWYLYQELRNKLMLELLRASGFEITLDDVVAACSDVPISSELAMACNLIWRIFSVHAADLPYVLRGSSNDDGDISLYDQKYNADHNVPCAKEWTNFVDKFKAGIVGELNPSMNVDDFMLYLDWT